MSLTLSTQWLLNVSGQILPNRGSIKKGGSRDEKWRSQLIRKRSVSWYLPKLSQLSRCNGGFGSCTTQNHLQTKQFVNGTWNSSRVAACALRNEEAVRAHRLKLWSVCEKLLSGALRNQQLVQNLVQLVQKKLGEILYLLICSFLPCLSWLLRSRLRKSRRDLWITLYIGILLGAHYILHISRIRVKMHFFVWTVQFVTRCAPLLRWMALGSPHTKVNPNCTILFIRYMNLSYEVGCRWRSIGPAHKKCSS
jgi:hypothetical protein